MTQKVFCIGFHKTGTSSLAAAFQMMGYSVCRRLGMLQDLIPDKNVLELIRNNHYKEIFKASSSYDVFCDNPWPLFYKELDEHYPNSKFILTIREEHSWLKSVLNYFKNSETEIREIIYGKASPIDNEELYLKRYRKHNEEVQEHFKSRPKDLLIIDIEKEEDQWAILCRFLGKEIPNQAFPHQNKSTPDQKNKKVTDSKSHKVVTFLKLPIQSKLLLMETTSLLIIVRLLILLLPFRVIARRLGEHMTETTRQTSSIENKTTENIGRAIRKVSRLTPFRSLCLEQAITCKFMLNRRGISSTIYFGLAKEKEASKLKAHAWTRSGNQTITGAKGRHQFKVVSTFGNSKESNSH
jgi:hypothetical protein